MRLYRLHVSARRAAAVADRGLGTIECTGGSLLRCAGRARCLVLLMLFDVWYRAHTFGPHVRDGLGINLWPATIGASEPLDCDEAAYAYIGHRILRGDVLYRDVTENKTAAGLLALHPGRRARRLQRAGDPHHADSVRPG